MRALPAVLVGLASVALPPSVSRVCAETRVVKVKTTPATRDVGREALDADLEILTKAKVKTDQASLLDYFRKRTRLETDRGNMLALVRQLGAEDFDRREKAAADLVTLAARALPYLKEAEKSADDVEVRRRAQKCRLLIEGEDGATVTAAAVRVLARRKPAEATKVLLAYMSLAEDAAVADELRDALAVTGITGGKADPALVKALADPLAARRAAAAEALGRGGATAQLPAVRKLLRDRHPAVRMRAAIGLIPHADKEAVVVLIATLKELNEDDAWPAEQLLVRLAGDQSPAVSLGTDSPSRVQCSAAWAEWWKYSGAKTDLAKAGNPPALLGYTLIVSLDNVWRGGRFRTGTVQEIGPDKKVRWKIANLVYPVDAQMVGADRVLIAEYQSQQVTERDRKGNIKWTYKVQQGWPHTAQRLASGNTFIATQAQLLEVNSAGKQLYCINRPGDVARARMLANGDVCFVTTRSAFVRIDRKTNKVVKSFNINAGWVQQFGGLDVLPTGRVLVPQMQLHKVVEYNLDGKAVWEAPVQWPTSATRLANGQTLVASHSTQQVYLLSRKGKIVWQYGVDGQVWLAAALTADKRPRRGHSN